MLGKNAGFDCPVAPAKTHPVVEAAIDALVLSKITVPSIVITTLIVRAVASVVAMENWLISPALPDSFIKSTSVLAVKAPDVDAVAVARLLIAVPAQPATLKTLYRRFVALIDDAPPNIFLESIIIQFSSRLSRC